MNSPAEQSYLSTVTDYVVECIVDGKHSNDCVGVNRLWHSIYQGQPLYVDDNFAQWLGCSASGRQQFVNAVTAHGATVIKYTTPEYEIFLTRTYNRVSPNEYTKNYPVETLTPDHILLAPKHIEAVIFAVASARIKSFYYAMGALYRDRICKQGIISDNIIEDGVSDVSTNLLSMDEAIIKLSALQLAEQKKDDARAKKQARVDEVVLVVTADYTLTRKEAFEIIGRAIGPRVNLSKGELSKCIKNHLPYGDRSKFRAFAWDTAIREYLCAHPEITIARMKKIMATAVRTPATLLLRSCCAPAALLLFVQKKRR